MERGWNDTGRWKVLTEKLPVPVDPPQITRGVARCSNPVVRGEMPTNNHMNHATSLKHEFHGTDIS